MRQEARKMALLEPYPPQLEQTLKVLDRSPNYKKRRWLKSGDKTRYPRFVYRYVGEKIPDEYLSDYLVESHFYLSSIAEFNDPFDMGAYVAISPDRRKRSEKFKRILKVHKPELNRQQRRKEISKLMSAPGQSTNIRLAYEKNINDMGGVCFTTRPRDLLMWSHYGSHHRGVSLQFHLANDIRTMGRLLRVSYSHIYPTIDWVGDTEKALGEVFGTKHLGWEYEQEYRIFLVDAAKSYLAFQPRALTGLIFGCRADHKMRERVLDILESRATKKLSPVTVYKAVKHPREYRVTIQKDVSLNWPS
jgi:hypothetical protein